MSIGPAGDDRQHQSEENHNAPPQFTNDNHERIEDATKDSSELDLRGDNVFEELSPPTSALSQDDGWELEGSHDTELDHEVNPTLKKVEKPEPIPSHPAVILQSLFKIGEIYGFDEKISEIRSFTAAIDVIAEKINSAYSVIHNLYSALSPGGYSRNPSLRSDYADKIPRAGHSEVEEGLEQLHGFVSGQRGTYSGVLGVKRDLEKSKNFLLRVLNETSFQYLSEAPEFIGLHWQDSWSEFAQHYDTSKTKHALDLQALRLTQTRDELVRIRQLVTQDGEAEILVEHTFLHPKLLKVIGDFKSKRSTNNATEARELRTILKEPANGTSLENFEAEASKRKEATLATFLNELGTLERDILMPIQLELERANVPLVPRISPDSIYDELCKAITLFSTLSDYSTYRRAPLADESQTQLDMIDDALKEIVEKAHANQEEKTTISERLIDWKYQISVEGPPSQATFNEGALRPVRDRMVQWLHDPSAPTAVNWLARSVLWDPEYLKEYKFVYGAHLVKARSDSPDNSSSFPPTWGRSLGGRCGGVRVSYQYRSYSWGTGIYMEVEPVYD